MEITPNNTNYLKNHWTQFSCILAILIVTKLLISISVENTSAKKLTGFSFIIIDIMLWLIIFVKIFTHPEILFGLPKLESKLSKYQKPNTIDTDIWQLKTIKITNIQDKKVTNVLENKITSYLQEIMDFTNIAHPFRDPNFSIRELAVTLEVPNSHLVYIFKYHCKIPFVAFKKYCKIKDAVHLIKNDYLKKNTLESLSNKIGFISYNTFFSSFKKYHKVSPKKYIDFIETNKIPLNEKVNFY